MKAAVRPRTVLCLVVALQLVAETALTPYWPLLFRTLFDVDDLAATGTYLTVCRVAGLIAMPLWGLAALRWPLPRLLVAGLLASAVFDLALALAPTLWSFTLFSAAVVASGSSLVLAYPALVAVVESDGRADRLTAVVTFSAVFHASAVVATLVGAGITGLPDPRWGLAAFAVVDLMLAVLVARWVPVERRPRAALPPSEKEITPGGCASFAEAGGRRPVVLLISLVVVVAVLVDAGIAVTRPFFVELLVRDGVPVAAAGLVFLLPAASALLVLPVAGRVRRRLGTAMLPTAATVSGLGLLLQASVAATAADLMLLVAARILFGFGLGLLLVALDLAVFEVVGTAGPGFGAVETGRSAALLAAPLLATGAASAWIGLPLVAGAALLLLASAAALVRLPVPPSILPHNQEVPRVLDPIR